MPWARVAWAVAELLAPACLLAGALLASTAALLRLDDIAEAAVAAAGVAALVVLLTGDRLVVGAAPVGGFGAVAAGLVAVCVLAGAAVRLLAPAVEDAAAPAPTPPPRAAAAGSAATGGTAAATALTGGGAATVALAASSELVYAGAVLTVVGGWLAAAVDEASGRAALRAAGRYALFCLAADLGLLAAPLLAGRAPAVAAGGLALSAAVRLRLFPFHGLSELARLGGRAYLTSVVVGGLVGVSLLAQMAPDQSAGIAAGLYAAALATALAATLALPLPHSYRVTLDLIGLVDAAHVAAAFAIGTPVALAAGLLHALSSATARAILLLTADTTNRRGQQRSRLRGPLGLLPFAFGFGSLTGMPPSPGFVARWVLYLALLDAGAWPLVLVLAAGSVGSLLELLRRIGGFAAPERSWQHGRALAIGLLLLWLPLGLIAVTPIVLLGGPLAASGPDASWSLGVERLFGLAGVAALLLCLAIVLLGFALYAERELRPLRRPIAGWRRLTRGAGWRGLRQASLAGTPWRWLAAFGEMIGGAAAAATAPWEARFAAVGVVAMAFALLLVALG
jgi:hydrogenase-4 component F